MNLFLNNLFNPDLLTFDFNNFLDFLNTCHNFLYLSFDDAHFRDFNIDWNGNLDGNDDILFNLNAFFTFMDDWDNFIDLYFLWYFNNAFNNFFYFLINNFFLFDDFFSFDVFFDTFFDNLGLRIILRALNLNFFNNFSSDWNLDTFLNLNNLCSFNNAINTFFNDLRNFYYLFDDSWYYNNFLNNLFNFNDFRNFNHFFNDFIDVATYFFNSFNSLWYFNNLLDYNFHWFLTDNFNNERLINLDDFRNFNDSIIVSINIDNIRFDDSFYLYFCDHFRYSNYPFLNTWNLNPSVNWLCYFFD